MGQKIEGNVFVEESEIIDCKGLFKKVERAIDWIQENPDGFAQRAVEFDRVIDSLNLWMGYSKLDQSWYRDVVSLKKKTSSLDVKKLPSLRELAGVSGEDEGSYESRQGVQHYVEKSFEELGGRINDKSWHFSTRGLESANALVSDLLILSYGFDLGRQISLGREDFSRTFVLSFKEVLYSRHKESDLLRDIWSKMRLEAVTYPEKLQLSLKGKNA